MAPRCTDIGIAQESHGFQGDRALLEVCSRERTQQRFVERIVLPLKEEIAEVMQFTPQKRSSDRIGKEVGGGEVGPSGTSATALEHATVLQFLQETFDVTSSERAQQRTVDVPMPRIWDDTVEVTSWPA